jgi:soluble lytic murein transglycosylase-like protein
MFGRWTSEQRQELIATLLIALICLVGAFLSGHLQAAEIPAAANQYRGELTRNARLAWGLDAPVATLAAQVHQESGWQHDAVSRVGAKGLAQFMPETARWIGGIFPELAARQPDNPVWALRALTAYDRWLWERIAAENDCERMAMVLSAYNGGLGWLLKDKALTQASSGIRGRWWGQVERHNAGRSKANFAENRGYPKRIIKTLQPAYASWGAGVC